MLVNIIKLVIISSFFENCYSIRCPLKENCLYELELNARNDEYKCIERNEGQISHINVSAMMNHTFGYQQKSLKIFHCQHIFFDYDKLSGSSMESLIAVGNKIIKIWDYSFSKFPNLMTLNLTDNEIREIAPFGFHGLKELKVLDLSDNKLTSLNSVILHGQSALEVIDLSNNNIITISIEAFGNCERLKELDLRDNFCINVDFQEPGSSLDIYQFNEAFKNCSIEDHFQELSERLMKVEAALETSQGHIKKLYLEKRNLLVFLIITTIALMLVVLIVLFNVKKIFLRADETLNYRYNVVNDQLFELDPPINQTNLAKAASSDTLCSDI
jgi:hypothetical protein